MVDSLYALFSEALEKIAAQETEDTLRTSILVEFSKPAILLSTILKQTPELQGEVNPELVPNNARLISKVYFMLTALRQVTVKHNFKKFEKDFKKELENRQALEIDQHREIMSRDIPRKCKSPRCDRPHTFWGYFAT